MTLPILYSFRRCPYAIRARMAILAGDLTCELREVSLANKPVEMISVSPKATVPVMVLASGAVLEESLDIMRYALERNDPHNWLSSAIEPHLGLISQFDRDFKTHLDGYKYPNRITGEPAPHPTFHRDQAVSILQSLEHKLMSAPFLSGQQLTFVDAALAPFVRQFANVDAPWFSALPLSGVQRWLSEILASPFFTEAMMVYPVWHAQHEPQVFGDRALTSKAAFYP